MSATRVYRLYLIKELMPEANVTKLIRLDVGKCRAVRH